MRSRGAALVEWAVAMPIMLLATFGVMQFALVMTAKVVVNHAAFSATRAALTVPTTDPRDGRAWEDRAADQALEAALVVCSPLGGSLADAGGTGTDLPGWGTLARSDRARQKLFLSDPGSNLSGSGASPGRPRLVTTPTQRRVRCDVTFDYELMFPFVELLFAGGRPWGSADPTQDRVFSTQGAEHAGWRHIRLTETCTLARPWD